MSTFIGLQKVKFMLTMNNSRPTFIKDKIIKYKVRPRINNWGPSLVTKSACDVGDVDDALDLDFVKRLWSRKEVGGSIPDGFPFL